MQSYKTDRSEHKKLCLKCEWLNEYEKERCVQCGAKIYQRKPFSVALTWNYTVAAFLFFIPANLLPMMIVTSLGIDEGSTIIEGVIYFVKHGELSIGIIIFIASIVVPIFKIASLIFMLMIIHFRLGKLSQKGIALYRTIRIIGKWSLLDIFVVAIMIAMVQFQNLATVHAGGAAFAFSLVVVLTMFATESFDPRLMYDIHDKKRSIDE